MAYEVVSKVLVLSFTDTNGKSVSITINNPDLSVDGETVSAAMDQMIAATCYGKEAIISNKVSAKFVTLQNQSVTLG